MTAEQLDLDSARRTQTFAEAVVAMLGRCTWQDGCLLDPAVRYGGVQWGGQRDGARKRMTAHRAVWTLANGPIPAGMIVLHSCDEPRCRNLAHLSLGTYAQNSAEAIARLRFSLVRARGTDIPGAVLTPGLVAEARRRARGGESIRSMSKDFSVGHTTLLSAVRGFTWQEGAEPPVPPVKPNASGRRWQPKGHITLRERLEKSR